MFGGTRGDGDLAAGNFVMPTLFADVSNDMSIAREEIFGPVLSVIGFADEDEAVRIANDTEYGLAATVWTSDIRRAMRVTKALRAGTVGINGYQLEPNSPFGGFGQSGLGREGGRAADRVLHRAEDRPPSVYGGHDVRSPRFGLYPLPLILSASMVSSSRVWSRPPYHG